MKSLFSFVLLLTFVFYSQHLTAQEKTREVKLKISLQMPEGSGTRGAAVAWNPALKLYYAAYGGNATFPMAVFNAQGIRISNSDLETMVDLRSIWYNPITKNIEGNGYNDAGWVFFLLDRKGIPFEKNEIIEGQHQPNEQSQGAFDYTTNSVYFFDGYGSVVVYDRSTGDEAKSIELTYDGSVADFSDFGTGIIYTNKSGAELGLLNRTTMEVDFFNKNTGAFNYRVALPSDTHIADFLSFSYANGFIWILDDNTRMWNGFKL
jgi:hypothetical protein